MGSIAATGHAALDTDRQSDVNYRDGAKNAE